MSLLEKNDATSTCEIDENLNFLRETYFFSGLPLEALRVFAYLCSRERFKAGEFLFRQGEDDSRAFYLITGQAVLERKSNGDAQAIRQASAGSFFGGMSLMGSMRRLFSLKAQTDTLCLVLTREKFSKTLEQFQEMAPRLLKTLAQAVATWEEGFLSSRADQCGECMPNLGVSLL